MDKTESDSAAIAATKKQMRDRKLTDAGHVPLGSQPASWRDASGHPWEFELEWAALNGGRAECIGLTMRSPSGSHTRALTATAWRSVKVGELLSQGRRDRVRGLRSMETDPDLGQRVRRSLRRFGAAPRKQQGRAFSEEELAEVADVYRHAVDVGEPPVKAVQSHFNIAHGTAKKRVEKARDQALLGPAIPGRSGEAPTRKRTGKKGRSQ